MFMCVSQDPDGLGGHNSQVHSVILDVSCAGPGVELSDPDGALPTRHVL